MKRGHRYAVRLDLGRSPDGKRIFKWHSGYATKRAAQQARTELLGALEHNTYVPPDTTILTQYLRHQWLPTIKTQVRPGTWSEYRSKAERHIIPAIGQVNLQKLTTAMLNAGARHRPPHRPVRPRHHPQSPHRRRPLGPAGPQPRAARHPTQGPPPRTADLDRRAAAPLPRQRPRGAAVCRLAAGGADRHAPRRGPRATLGPTSTSTAAACRSARHW